MRRWRSNATNNFKLNQTTTKQEGDYFLVKQEAPWLDPRETWNVASCLSLKIASIQEEILCFHEKLSQCLLLDALWIERSILNFQLDLHNGVGITGSRCCSDKDLHTAWPSRGATQGSPQQGCDIYYVESRFKIFKSPLLFSFHLTFINKLFNVFVGNKTFLYSWLIKEWSWCIRHQWASILLVVKKERQAQL